MVTVVRNASLHHHLGEVKDQALWAGFTPFKGVSLNDHNRTLDSRSTLVSKQDVILTIFRRTFEASKDVFFGHVYQRMSHKTLFIRKDKNLEVLGAVEFVSVMPDKHLLHSYRLGIFEDKKGKLFGLVGGAVGGEVSIRAKVCLLLLGGESHRLWCGCCLSSAVLASFYGTGAKARL